MKVLRVSLTYPRESMPGIGLPCFYHANNSVYDSLILTLKLEGIMLPSKKNVRVQEIDVNNPALGHIDNNFFSKLLSYSNKFFCQLLFFFKSLKFINQYAPDVAHVYSPIPLVIGIYCKLKFKSKLVLSLHGTDVERLARSMVLGKMLAIPDEVVCVSQSMIDRLSEIKTKKKISYIGNGYEQTIFYPKNMKRKKQFINVANLRWQKGHLILLESFAIFLESHPEYELVIIGDGPDKEKITNKSKELRIDNRVKFLGIKNREFIASELNESIAFVLSSVVEGFPKVVIEAMGTGTPVISTNVGNVSMVVGEAGLIAEPNNPVDLCNKMKSFVESNNWKKFSEEALNKASQYTWSAVVDRLEKHYTM